MVSYFSIYSIYYLQHFSFQVLIFFFYSFDHVLTFSAVLKSNYQFRWYCWMSRKPQQEWPSSKNQINAGKSMGEKGAHLPCRQNCRLYNHCGDQHGDCLENWTWGLHWTQPPCCEALPPACVGSPEWCSPQGVPPLSLLGLSHAVGRCTFNVTPDCQQLPNIFGGLVKNNVFKDLRKPVLMTGKYYYGLAHRFILSCFTT